MKWITLLLFGLLFSTYLVARNDIDLSTFNKHMMQNMDQVIGDNPEIYEKNTYGRTPASTQDQKDSHGTTEKLDGFEEQADGRKSW